MEVQFLASWICNKLKEKTITSVVILVILLLVWISCLWVTWLLEGISCSQCYYPDLAIPDQQKMSWVTKPKGMQSLHIMFVGKNSDVLWPSGKGHSGRKLGICCFSLWLWSLHIVSIILSWTENTVSRQGNVFHVLLQFSLWHAVCYIVCACSVLFSYGKPGRERWDTKAYWLCRNSPAC